MRAYQRRCPYARDVAVIGNPAAQTASTQHGGLAATDVRFSNRRFGVKRFQAIQHCGVDVARGLVLLFGIGTRALPSWDSRTRRHNLLAGLAVRQTSGPSGHASSPHPSSREGHLSTAGWISSFLLSHRSYGPLLL